MATLIYSPGIRVHIETINGILDVTDDIAQWQLDLRENAIHTFGFTLQNAQRKYDGLLLPMDKITVQLKRLNWLQNFTGYLNDGPIFQAWPGTIPLTASCTMKVPQFWFWDPTSVEANSMMAQAINTGDPNNPDGKLVQLVIDALTKVVQWDKTRIHIGQVPEDWFAFAEKVGDLIEADSDMTAMIGRNATINGTPVSGTVKIPAGTYAGITLDANQANNASIIYNTVVNVCKQGIREARMAFMTAWVESTLHNWANSSVPDSLILPNDGVQHDGTSVGVFQQQNSWGTAAERLNVAIATQKFVQRLVAVEGPPGSGNPSPDGDIIQAVQVSADPDRYQKLENFGVALSQFCASQAAGATGPNPNTAPAVGTGLGTPTVGAGDYAIGGQLAVVGANLITSHPPGWIIYQQGGDDNDINPTPRTLDCSSLVDWVYYHTTGQHLWKSPSRSTAQTIYDQSTPIPLELAYQIQGAGLFINETGGIGHVGLALGYQANGDWQHVAAHMHYPSHPQDDVNISAVGNQFNRAGLLPGIDYSGSAVNQAAADQLKAILNRPTTVAPALGNVAAVSTGANSTGTGTALQQLINTLIYQPQATIALSDNLLPSRQLMVNQPFLPWLANVINSTMRSWCSAPNGDFISWFPDYFGIWGTAAVMNIELIELQDFTVKWSDQQMVTHQYVIGSQGSTAFNADGSVTTLGTYTQLALDQQTQGIATMDFPEIFQAIYGVQANPAWTQAFLKRFGARPNVTNVPQIHGGQNVGRAEFFMALYYFMQAWAGMFSATVPLTFMPELWPGMLLRIPEFGFQAYVTGVTHSGSYGSSGSFTTDVQIIAPANIGGAGRDNLLSLLPNGGQPLVASSS